MAENNKVDVVGLVRAAFEQEAKAIPQEQIDRAFSRVMTELNKRKEAERPSLDGEIAKCASIAAKQECRSKPPQIKTNDRDEL